MSARTDAPLCPAPDPRPRPPSHPVPPLACDTHMHICGPPARHPYASQRVYTPPDALLPDYLRVAQALGIERVVFVQPSVHGTDNAAMLEAMRNCPLPCRGVAVVDADVGDAALHDWHAAGVRGVRVNLVDTVHAQRSLPVERLHRLAARIAPFGWHLELLAHVDDYPALDRELGDLPVDLVFGHLGYLHRGIGPDHPGFAALLRLAARGRCWVKLTGAYRLTDAPLPYAPVAELARALLQSAPARLLWGSDWPHVMMRGPMPNDGELLDLLFDWVTEPGARHGILVDNPAALYGF